MQQMPRIGWFGSSVMVLMALALGGCSNLGAKPDGKGDVKIEGKIGMIDPQRLLNETNAGKRAKDILVGFSKNRQTLMELDEKELRRMEEDFVKQANVLSPAARREREEQFRRRMQEYQQKAGELNREVQEKQKDVLEAFREKTESVSATIGKRLGLKVIIDKSKGGPTLYHEEGLDITGQAIEEFNRVYP
jgi:outer membrane protein